MDAERGDPGDVDDGEHLCRSMLEEGRQRDGKPATAVSSARTRATATLRLGSRSSAARRETRCRSSKLA